MEQALKKLQDLYCGGAAAAAAAAEEEEAAATAAGGGSGGGSSGGGAYGRPAGQGQAPRQQHNSAVGSSSSYS